MNHSDPIAVFAYAFQHRKTQDFLFELATAGFCNVTVIGAPWKALPHGDSNSYFSKMLQSEPALNTSDVCRALNFSFHECSHEDVDTISKLQIKSKFQLGIISGARIIKRNIIELFSEGILNIHPGKLPETAGLDLFFYTLKKNVSLGATAHYIDPRVDAGDELFFEETPLGPDDTIETVQYNNYQSQIRALRRYIYLRKRGEITRQPIDRPCKNDPMSPEEKRSVLNTFPHWRSIQYREQRARDLMSACQIGEVEKVKKILASLPGLVEFRCRNGWTPLIVAAHNNQVNVIQTLIDQGSDPNICGKKGTTPLMYAKTALLGQENPNFAILEALLEAGADPLRCDANGKNIFHYLQENGDKVIAAWLKSKQDIK